MYHIKYARNNRGTRWSSYKMRHCGTNRMFVGSIPDGVIGIFIDSILSAALWPGDRLSL